MNKYLDLSHQYIDVAYNFMLANNQFIGGALVMAVFIFVGSITRRWEVQRHQRKLNAVRGNKERWMTTPEEENIEKVLMSDGITDVIEDLVVRGKLRSERAVVWYRRFGNLLNLPDLLAKHEVLLKDMLKKSLNKKDKKVIPFPDVAVAKPKGNRLLAKLGTKSA